MKTILVFSAIFLGGRCADPEYDLLRTELTQIINEVKGQHPRVLELCFEFCEWFHGAADAYPQATLREAVGELKAYVDAIEDLNIFSDAEFQLDHADGPGALLLGFEDFEKALELEDGNDSFLMSPNYFLGKKIRPIAEEIGDQQLLQNLAKVSENLKPVLRDHLRTLKKLPPFCKKVAAKIRGVVEPALIAARDEFQKIVEDLGSLRKIHVVMEEFCDWFQKTKQNRQDEAETRAVITEICKKRLWYYKQHPLVRVPAKGEFLYSRNMLFAADFLMGAEFPRHTDKSRLERMCQDYKRLVECVSKIKRTNIYDIKLKAIAQIFHPSVIDAEHAIKTRLEAFIERMRELDPNETPALVPLILAP